MTAPVIYSLMLAVGEVILHSISNLRIEY